MIIELPTQTVRVILEIVSRADPLNMMVPQQDKINIMTAMQKEKKESSEGIRPK